MMDHGLVMQVAGILLQYGILLALLLFVSKLARAMFSDMKATYGMLQRDVQGRREATLEILEAPDASMVGRRIAFAGELTMGRGEDNSIVFHDAYISHHHVRLDVFQNRFCIEHAGGRSPTYVNARELPLQGRIFLKSGDIIKLGLVVLRFER